MAAYSHPRLGLQSYANTDDTDGSSSSGELRRGLITRPSTDGPRRRRSYGDVALAAGTGVVLPRIKPRRSDDDEEHADDACLGASETAAMAPRYVSFEDLIGTETFTFWDRGGGGQLPPDERVITDPLIVKTAPRLYNKHEVATVKPPRKRRRSPGPLGTRRGSAMHGLVKKYVHPFFGFIAGIFCCSIPS